MWLALPFIIFLILVLAGGLVVGGIYALVLVPLAGVLLVGWVVAGIMRQARDPEVRAARAGSINRPRSVGATSDEASDMSPAPATPDEVLDRRQGAG